MAPKLKFEGWHLRLFNHGVDDTRPLLTWTLIVYICELIKAKHQERISRNHSR